MLHAHKICYLNLNQEGQCDLLLCPVHHQFLLTRQFTFYIAAKFLTA